MSETPRNDDEQFRDPLAPPEDAPGHGAPRDDGPGHGAPVENAGSTQPLPPPPPPPQNPYAAPPAPGYGPPPPGYGQPPAGYGPPGGYGAPPAPSGYAAPRQMSGNTIALLVVAGLTTLGCGFGIVALVFAIIAATKSDQPQEQAKYTRWGWIAEIAGLAFVVIAIVLVIIFGIAVSSSGTSTGY